MYRTLSTVEMYPIFDMDGSTIAVNPMPYSLPSFFFSFIDVILFTRQQRASIAWAGRTSNHNSALSWPRGVAVIGGQG